MQPVAVRHADDLARGIDVWANGGRWNRAFSSEELVAKL